MKVTKVVNNELHGWRYYEMHIINGNRSHFQDLYVTELHKEALVSDRNSFGTYRHDNYVLSCREGFDIPFEQMNHFNPSTAVSLQSRRLLVI
jgi:hypothetical protein